MGVNKTMQTLVLVLVELCGSTVSKLLVKAQGNVGEIFFLYWN